MADQKQFNGTVNFKGTTNIDAGVRIKEKYVEPVFTAATTHTDGATFVKNTLNFINVTATKTFNLPAAATSTKGDVVIVKYINTVANSAVHTYDTDAAGFGVQSGIVVSQNAASGQVFAAVAPLNATSDELKLTGAANAGIGIGTQLYFAFDGTYWYVHHGEVYQKGDGSANPTVAFS